MAKIIAVCKNERVRGGLVQVVDQTRIGEDGK